jgi:hypothetical protein
MSADLTARVQARVAELRAANPVQGPFLDPCACGKPRHEHSGPTHAGRWQIIDADGAKVRSACTKWRPDVVEAKARAVAAADGRDILAVYREHQRNEHRKTAQPKESGQISLGASDAGACKRSVWYRNFADTLEDYVPAFVDDKKSLMGTSIHESFLGATKALYPWRQIEMRLTVPGFDRDVRIDSYDPYTGVVEDLKTAGDAKWRMLVDGPTEGTWKQTRIYGFGLEEAGYLVTELRLVYVHREGDKAPEVFTEPYDRAKALEAVSELATLGDLLAAGVVPEREGDGPDSGYPCAYCPARNHCWNVDTAATVGRGPVSVTLLGLSPEDKEVEWALSQYRDGLAIENEGKSVKAKFKAMLDGIEPGRYGDLVWAEDTRWEKDTNSYIRALENALVTPEALRPSMEALQKVAERRFPRTSQAVRPVRAATLAKEAKARAKVAALKDEALAGGDAA